MPDPIRDLESFPTDGVAVDPLSPAEVRRRGDRRRRRHHAAAAVAGAAAIALVAVPVAVLAGGGGDDQRGQEPPYVAPSSASEIPAGFPLTEGWPTSSAETHLYGPTDDPGMANGYLVCGRPLPEPGYTDVLTAERHEPEDEVQFRRLAAFPDVATAEKAVADMRAAWASCPREDTVPSSPGGTAEWRHEVADVRLAGADRDSFGVTSQLTTASGEGIGRQTRFVSLRVGRAVLTGMWWTHGFESDQAARAALAQAMAESASTPVAAMCVFASDPCTTAPASERPSPTDASTPAAPVTPQSAPASAAGSASPAAVDARIADDFPLDAGFPAQSEMGADGYEGPARDLDPVELRACGEPLPDPAHEDRLLARYSSAEDYRTRQLTTYADAEAAVAASRALVAAVRDCPDELRESDGHTVHREVRDLAVGGESWAVLERDTLDGAETPFGSTVVVVRVGSAVLLVEHGGHAGYPTPENLDALLASTSEPVAAMCAFTVAGC
jgi:hypothetical protein